MGTLILYSERTHYTIKNMLQEINILLKDIILDINHSIH